METQFCLIWGTMKNFWLDKYKEKIKKQEETEKENQKKDTEETEWTLDV